MQTIALTLRLLRRRFFIRYWGWRVRRTEDRVARHLAIALRSLERLASDAD